MQNFAKSILNYYAAFNETRFRFTTKSTQKWSNNDLTLDFSVFPEFQKDLLTQLQKSGRVSLTLKPGDYIITLDSDEFKKRIIDLVELNCTPEQLTQLRTELESSLEEGAELDNYSLFRAWNLQFRKLFGELLLQLQEEKKQELIADLDIEHLPLSTLNATNIEQELFDSVKHIATSSTSEPDFISAVLALVQSFSPRLVMYELYSLLLGFHQLTATGTVYLFIHQLIHQENSYPLLSVEIMLETAGSKREITLHAVRDLLQINTAAINSTKMGKVLATPRACSGKDLSQYVIALEMYFQAYYQKTDSFIFTTNFKKIVGQNLPTLSPRIGLQIVEKEDRTLLDYSELITSIDSGSGKKFVDLVTEYVDGAIEQQTTFEEVHQQFASEYPPRSAKNFLSDIPLTLNSNQRKILTAAKNPKNRVMRIDGPPGTGKSYTITALVYLANLLNKTVLITSHKPQALDVVEEKLTQQFRSVHPFAKPPILRLTKVDAQTLNSVENTLSDTVINQTLNRTTQVNTALISGDIANLAEQFETTMAESWDAGGDQYAQLELIAKLLQITQQLGIKLVLRKSAPVLSKDQLQKLVSELEQRSLNISLQQLEFVVSHIDKLSEWKSATKDLNPTSPQVSSADAIQPSQMNLTQIVDQLDLVLEKEAKLDQLRPDELQTLPKISSASRGLTPEKLQQAVDLVQQLNKISRQITAKLFRNEGKRRLEHRLQHDFPTIHEEIKKTSLETVMFDLERDLDHLNNTKTKYPWLLESYILSQEPPSNVIDETLNVLLSSDHAETTKLVSVELGKPLIKTSCKELQEALAKVNRSVRREQALEVLQPLLTTFGLETSENEQLQHLMNAVEGIIAVISPSFGNLINNLFITYPELLKVLGVNVNDLKSLRKLLDSSEVAGSVWQFIDLNNQLENSELVSLQTELLLKHQEKQLRLLVQQNEQRFAQLTKHPTEVQKILKAIHANQRITVEQAKVLFSHIPCIIAPPDLISQHFPMEADMIDWLIIDEASQVSIAESLSLMLRSKQTFVFGDELQYGAVGATNVSSEYSKEYFRHVLEDYSRDKNEVIDQATIDQITDEVSQPVSEDDVVVTNAPFIIDVNTKEWIKTFGIRTSTLDFAKAIRNYSDSLTVHFRSYPEIISYSNEFFYKPSEINLVTSRIRTKPISQVLEFVKVECKGFAGANINLDEIEVIRDRLSQLFEHRFTGSIGIICSFREQTDRMKDILRKDLPCFSELVHHNALKIWFVGDVQGEERDIVFYSFVEDTKTANASLSTIYPVVGGVADSIRNLRMQRLNVGFSRAKDTMIFVHSMDIKDYKSTRLGDALDFYWKVLNSTTDNFISDTSIFDSPREEFLYSLITQTEFFKTYKDHIRLIAQFEIGKYLKEEYRRYIPNYRVDFLLTLTVGHEEHSLIIEYDGLEFHTQSPHQVRTTTDFDREFIEYDIQRQLELESYGYRFLRFNKFTLIPEKRDKTEVDVVNEFLFQKMAKAIEELSTYAVPTPQPLVLKEDGPAYISDTYRSPMEEQLEQFIRQTEFYQKHKEKLELLTNYPIHLDLNNDMPNHMPDYEVDFLLKINGVEPPFKLIIEYDGIKHHTDNSDDVDSFEVMENNLTDDHIYRQYDLEELGYKLLRLNKFILFADSQDPVVVVNELLEQQYQQYLQGIQS